MQVPNLNGQDIFVKQDERPRRDTTIEKLSLLKPAFKKDGSVTGGNSSGLNDGASAVLLMSGTKAYELHLTPMARWVGSASAGVPPRIMGIGPVPATRKLLTKIGLTVQDLELVEINEAFAAQTLAVIKELDFNEEIINVNGGAIALGHALGCSGARILTTLLHEMKRRSTLSSPPRYGLATLCVGVGQGEATIVERMG